MDDDSSVASNQRSVTLKEAIEDPRTPLDFDLKATLTTSLLNCNPKDSPSLPIFRVTELLHQCTSFDPKKFGEFTTVDSVLSLYILCLHFALSPSIPSPACLECFNAFMVWISECLVVDDELGSKLFVMRNIDEVFQRDDSIDTKYKQDAFHDALDISRQFLRETYALTRDLKQYRSIADETMIPKNPDCIRPSTIYFMLSFALCHVISVLHAQENLSMVPGLVETLVLMLVTTSVEEGTVKGAATEAAAFVKKSNDLASFVCHYVLTPRVLQEVILVRSRVGRVLKVSEIEYVLYRTSAFKEFSDGNKGPLATRILPAQVGSKMDFRAQGFHVFQKAHALVSVMQQHTQMLRSDEDSSVQSMTGSLSDQGSLSSHSVVVDPKVKRIFSQYRSLKKAFRLPFMVLQSTQVSLHPFSIVFDGRYKLKNFSFPNGDLSAVKSDLSSQAASQTAITLERILFTFSRMFVAPPRFLNPKQESYWICQYLIEFLYKLTSEGAGFCPLIENEVRRVRQRLKDLKKASTTSSSSKSTTMLERSLQQVKEKVYLEGRLLHLETLVRNPPGFLPAIQASEMKLGDILEELQLAPKMDDHKIKSVVWHSLRKKDRKARARIVTVGMDVSSEHPLASLPSKGAAIEYAKRLEEDRQDQHMRALQEQQRLNDLQEEIVAKNRARKAATLRSMKEKLKEDIDQKNTFLQVYKAEMAKLTQEREMQARKEERAKVEAEVRERQRIEEIRLSKLDRERQEQEELKLQLELEASFIARIVDDQEAKEIVRRLKEEDRMCYLEERRRAIEQKREERERKQEEEKQRAKERAMEVANRAQARLRQGNFVWHNGKFGYYDNVRKELQEYVQYEDEYGRSYYYDPIYNSCQYRPPADSAVHSYTEEQRKEYDAMYGEGAYDAYMADIAFKDSVNKNGGYYNENKEWIVANGYYDENYNWVEYEGFYDDQGKFVRFAKVSGDLTFMV